MSETTALIKEEKILLSCIHDVEAKMFSLKKYWQAKKDKWFHICTDQPRAVVTKINIKGNFTTRPVNQKILETYLAT